MSSNENLLSKALELQEAGDLTEAERLLKKIVSSNPEESQALSMLGVVVQQQERSEEAINFYQRALDAGAGNVALLSNLGAAYRDLGEQQTALDYYRQATRVDADYAPAHFNAGVLSSTAGDLVSARESFETTLKLQPNFADAHNNLANVLKQLGDLSGMLQHQCQAVQLKPENAHYVANLGRTLYEQKKYDEALNCFQTACQLSPHHSDYQMDLAVCYRELGEFQKAFDCYQQAVELAPGSVNAAFSCGVMGILIKQYPLAADYFQTALKMEPQNATIHLHLGKALLGLEKFEAAAESFNHALQFNPELSTAYFNLGTTLFQLQQVEPAIVNLQKAVALEPGNALFVEYVGRALKITNRLTEAADSYRRLCQLQPEAPSPWVQLGSCQLNLGQYESARDSFHRAIELDPQNKVAWNNLGNSWNHQGKGAESIQCYLKALEFDPNYHPAHSNLAEVYRNIGRIEKSRHHYLLSKNGTNDNRVELQRTVMLPPIYQNHEELPVYRRQLEQNLDRLIAEKSYLDPTKDIVPPLFYLAYQGLPDRPLHEKFCQLMVPANDFKPSSEIAKHRPEGKIRVGFLSHHFKNHTIGHLTNGIVSELSREQFHVTVMSQTIQNDKLGQLFQREADDYIVLSSDLKRAIQLIQQQDLDILYYPDLGMDPYTLTLSQLRLAPVQCVSWGHPVTTGCPVIDYYITSELIETSPEAQEHYTEKLIRFKTINVYYQPVEIPARFSTRAELGLPEDKHLYICPQSLFKFHPDMDEVFAGILEQDPNGVIVLIEGLAQEWRQELEKRFARTIPEHHDRILFVPRLGHNDYMSLNYVADVMIDPLHFGGGNTTYQALALGLPVVSLPSDYQRGRITQGLYRKMNMMDCVVNSVEEYIRLSVELGTQPEKRAEMSDKIKATNGHLFRDRSAITEYEQFFKEAVQASRNQQTNVPIPKSA